MRLVLSLRTWLVLSHGTVLVLPLLVFIVSGALGRDLQKQTAADLIHQGDLLALLVASEVRHVRDDAPDADLYEVRSQLLPAAATVKEATLAAVRVLDPYGVVVASSGAQLGEDLSDRPEVQEAMSGERGLIVRPRTGPRPLAPLSSRSRFSKWMVFVATPIVLDNELVGVVLLSRTPREELQTLYHMAPRLVWGAGFAVLFTLFMSLYVSHLYTRSLTQLAATADRIREGSFHAGNRRDLARPEVSHVAEARALTSAVTAMTERLQARLAYISEFAGNVAHEFRTPIATLRGTVELLHDDDQMPPEQRLRFLSNAQMELDRLERLLTGLLELARAEEEPRAQPVILDALMEEAAAHHGATASGSAGTVSGDAVQLRAALKNLLENARRYGGEDIRITGFRTAREAGFVVEDDGPGISEANQRRVFERFFTTDRNGGGTGVGLALVRAVAESHGGGVDLQSEPGRTAFRFWLPAQSASQM